MNKEILPPVQPEPAQYRSLQILDELSNNDALTQRDLSQRLGIALGLVNSYIKNLVAKGYITVRNIPTKRYAYYLTPKGFAEKSRLALDLLQDYTRIYREARNNYRQLFFDLERSGVRRIVFAGADEVAEFAYITLQETGLELVGIVDQDRAGGPFFGRTVRSLADADTLRADCIVITSYLKREKIAEALAALGIDRARVRTIFTK